MEIEAFEIEAVNDSLQTSNISLVLSVSYVLSFWHGLFKWFLLIMHAASVCAWQSNIQWEILTHHQQHIQCEENNLPVTHTLLQISAF